MAIWRCAMLARRSALLRTRLGLLSRVRAASRAKTTCRPVRSIPCELTAPGLLCSDADNVTRVAIQPESSSEAAAGRRLQSTTLTRRPVLRVSDTAGNARAEIASEGTLTVRDSSDNERFKADESGMTVKDTDGVKERVKLSREGLGIRGAASPPRSPSLSIAASSTLLRRSTLL